VTDELLAVADGLYALPLERFTPARDALVKEHKADKALVASLKALKKPSVAAWVVNLFVRREPAQVEQVIAVGEALREAQEGMDGAELRALTRQRRQLTSAVTQQARSLAAEEGVKVTSAVADQVEATLTAALLDPACATAVRSGLLVRSLSATGVDEVDVASALAVPDALGFEAKATEPAPTPRPELRVVPQDPEDTTARKREEAQELLEQADRVVRLAEKDARKAARSVEKVQARSLQLQSEFDELKRRLTDLENKAEETDEELEEAESVREDAEEALAAAQHDRDRAREKLESLA
jgi:DNA repair exonuclease SbcCD ATPase subunit